jgi:hypothetical protein
MSNSGFIVIDGAISHAMPFEDTVTVGGHALGEVEHAAEKAAALISLSLQKVSFLN